MRKFARPTGYDIYRQGENQKSSLCNPTNLGSNQSKFGICGCSVAISFKLKEIGIPCICPVSDVKGVLISAWASTQRTQALGWTLRWAWIVARETEWSPPIVRHKRWSRMIRSTSSESWKKRKYGSIYFSPSQLFSLQLIYVNKF